MEVLYDLRPNSRSIAASRYGQVHRFTFRITDLEKADLHPCRDVLIIKPAAGSARSSSSRTLRRN